MIAWLRRLFAPQGNLLTTEVEVEVTMHMLSSGEMKTNISKFADNPQQDMAQAVLRMFVYGLIGFAKEHRITIQWDRVAAMHPPYEEHQQELEARRAGRP